jgi:hypothetical protein
VNTEWEGFRIIFEPEFIDYLYYDTVERIVEDADLPDSMGELFLIGTYYALKISYPNSESFHIYSDVREPLSPQIREPDLPQGSGEYFRRVHLFMYNGQWIFSIEYYHKIQ